MCTIYRFAIKVSNVFTVLTLPAFHISFNDRPFWKLLNMVAYLSESAMKVVVLIPAFWRMPITQRSRVFEVTPLSGGT